VNYFIVLPKTQGFKNPELAEKEILSTANRYAFLFNENDSLISIARKINNNSSDLFKKKNHCSVIKRNLTIELLAASILKTMIQLWRES